MAAITDDAHFSKNAKVEIQKRDGSSRYNATVDISSFEESGFEREVDTETYFGNAKVTIEKTQNNGTVTMSVRMRRGDWDAILHGGTVDSNGIGSMEAGGNQDKYRIVFLVSRDPAVTEARDAVATGYDTVRRIYAEARATSFTPSLEADGLIEGEMVFDVPPFDDQGSSNLRLDTQNEGLGSVEDYTSSYKYPAV